MKFSKSYLHLLGWQQKNKASNYGVLKKNCNDRNRGFHVKAEQFSDFNYEAIEIITSQERK